MKSLTEVYRQNRIDKLSPITMIDQFGNYQQYFEDKDDQGIISTRKRLRRRINLWKKKINLQF
ncbi:hypothetical protein HHL23_09295 [Chryseobacterium sp. RP-3-3]|uniref:Uncharacterized protein n=1 Tax=Chryseobacterium antibioticum TaxID=2728847 RepID=A0A7Y0AMH7_9FLAO|nr:hypothetical protein [Chryseobacterium antibioticum]NML69994.1 hypothetical protein [Chryseobacterium antibioticum]